MRLALTLSLGGACPSAAQELMSSEAFDAWCARQPLHHLYSDGGLRVMKRCYIGGCNTVGDVEC